MYFSNQPMFAVTDLHLLVACVTLLCVGLAQMAIDFLPPSSNLLSCHALLGDATVAAQISARALPKEGEQLRVLCRYVQRETDLPRLPYTPFQWVTLSMRDGTLRVVL